MSSWYRAYHVCYDSCMAQALYCPSCQAMFDPTLGGPSCPACGEELIRGRVPAGRKPPRRHSPYTSRAVWDKILKRDVCCYCADARTTTIDHIEPKALGGAKSSWENRTGSCQPCNGRKAHTPLLFFMLEERGVDISHLKTPEGNWPIPDEVIEREPLPLPDTVSEPPKPHELFQLFSEAPVPELLAA